MLKELPHIPRCVSGGNSADKFDAALDALVEKNTAKDVFTYNIDLK